MYITYTNGGFDTEHVVWFYLNRGIHSEFTESDGEEYLTLNIRFKDGSDLHVSHHQVTRDEIMNVFRALKSATDPSLSQDQSPCSTSSQN